MAQGKKVKVGFFMDDFYPSINSVNLVMDNCARSLSEDYDIVLVVPCVDKNYVDDFPYKVIRVKGVSIKKIGYTLATPCIDCEAMKELYAERFDLIHFHSPFIMGRLAIKVARKTKVPVVGTIHVQFWYEFDRLYLKQVFKKTLTDFLIETFNACDECFAVNEAIKDVYAHSGVTAKISVVPNATDLATPNDIGQDKDFIDKRFCLDEKDNVLLFVGRIGMTENTFFLLESLQALRDKGVNFKMLFVGPLDDGEDFCKTIKQLQLENQVKICGKTFNRRLLAKLYARADLLLLPSSYHAASLVYIEAASQFTPTVFIEGAPIASNVIDNYNGFIAPFDKDAYADKITEALSDKSVLHDISKTCHDTLSATWHDACATLSEQYTRIVQATEQETHLGFCADGCSLRILGKQRT